jgi:prepilin-type N-terminal cleavage/methylation domain-containing protein
MKSPTTARKAAAFSLIELLIVITILGVVLFLAFPNIVQVKSDSERELAKARAEALNIAAAAYVQNQSLGNWGTLTEEQRYQEIMDYIAFPATNLESFLPSSDFGLSFNPTSPHKIKAILSAPGSTNVPY